MIDHRQSKTYSLKFCLYHEIDNGINILLISESTLIQPLP